MPKDCNFEDTTIALIRPRLLIETAQWAARRYRRTRDLPGAIAGLLARPTSEILPKLTEAEARCEDERRSRQASYRATKHVQILAALLAESIA